jgi:predicted AlkP superfamily phosphohydrolase/phosphomutase
MKRLLVFGLDGASLPILKGYIQRHPGGFFDKVERHGTANELISTLPYFTAPAWSTFATGLDPSRHGMFHWRGRYSMAQRARPLISSAHVREATIWSYLSRLEHRVSVTNFPMEFPAPAIFGRYICGTLAPESETRTSWPPTLIDKVRTAIPDFLFEMTKGLSHVDKPQQLVEHILKVGRNHYDAMLQFGDVQSSDFALHVVTITDRMQHFLWDCLDHTHPNFNETRAALGNPVDEVYAEAESVLEELWASGRWNNLLIVSDHGMGPSLVAFHVDRWLIEQGYATARESGEVDVERSLAYSGDEPECAIYVNRQDRDGTGIAADDYSGFVERLSQSLLLARQPESGLAAVTRVHRADAIHAGPFVRLAPDVILEPAEGVHPRPGPAPSNFSAATRLFAAHRRAGLFIGYGDGFVPGGASAQPLHIRDCFPLMCALMGAPIPDGLDGRFAGELLTPEYASCPVDKRMRWHDQVGPEVALQSDNAELLERMRELGYA